MSQLQPQGETLRRAVRWLSAERERCPEKPFSQLVNDACLRFDLTPKDSAALARYTKEQSREETP